MDKFILLAALMVFLACSKNKKDATVTPGTQVQAVSVTAVSPDKGDPGTTITITGTGFSTIAGNLEVKIGTYIASIDTVTPTKISVTAPANMIGGTYDITVRSNAVTASRSNAFHVVDWIVTTIAGSGNRGSANGEGSLSSFINPVGIVADRSNNLYVTDENLIRKITPSGIVSIYAGKLARGNADGILTDATFNAPTTLAIDGAGNLYVADQWNHLIRKISPAGMVTTIAGTGIPGNDNGIGTMASFNMPYGIAVNPQGTTIYVGDYGNNKIRLIDLATNNVSSYAGNGTSNSSDGSRMTAGIPKPGGLHLAANGDLYVTERGGGKIRRISAGGDVSTIGGSVSVSTIPTQLVTDLNQNTYVVYKGLHVIRTFSKTGNETTLAGTLTYGDKTGSARLAAFLSPEGIALTVDGDGKLTFYICDSGNLKIKKLTRE